MAKEKFKHIAWCCFDCGTYTKGGKMASLISTWHVAMCDVCHRTAPVTESRDYGYFSADEVLRMEARAKVVYGE